MVIYAAIISKLDYYTALYKGAVYPEHYPETLDTIQKLLLIQNAAVQAAVRGGIQES